MNDVVIYTTMLCPYCSHAKRILREHDVEFEEIDVTFEAVQRREMTARAGGRTSVPQIFFGDQHIGGCDDLFALQQSGELSTLLGRK